MSDATRPITKAQITKLWAQARELGLEADELHAMVAELAGKASIRALTAAEGSRVIDALVERGASGQGRRRLPPLAPGVVRLATPWQLEKLAELIETLGWSEARWGGVLKQAIGRPYPRTSAEAAKCIDAVKAVLKRERREESHAREAAT